MKPALPKNAKDMTGIVKMGTAACATSLTAREMQAVRTAAIRQQQGAPQPGPAPIPAPMPAFPPLRQPALDASSSDDASSPSPQPRMGAEHPAAPTAAAARAAAAQQAAAAQAAATAHRAAAQQAASDAAAARERQRQQDRAAQEAQHASPQPPPTGGDDGSARGEEGEPARMPRPATGRAGPSPAAPARAAGPRRLHRSVEAALAARGLEAAQLSSKGEKFFPRVLNPLVEQEQLPMVVQRCRLPGSAADAQLQAQVDAAMLAAGKRKQYEINPNALQQTHALRFSCRAALNGLGKAQGKRAHGPHMPHALLSLRSRCVSMCVHLQ